MKDISEVKDLIREAFKINGLAGRITSNIMPDGKGSLHVWDKGLVPRVVARIIPSIDRLILREDRAYEKEGQKFAELYRLKYLFNDGYMNIIYRPNPAIALYQDGAQI